MLRKALYVIFLLSFIGFLVSSIFSNIGLQVFQENSLKRLDVIEKRISRLEKMQKNNNKFDKQTTRNFQVMHKSLVVLRLQMFYLADRTDVLSTALERVGQHKRILKKLNR